MNANVFLEANHDTLTMKAWPKEIREKPHSLDQCEKTIILLWVYVLPC